MPWQQKGNAAAAEKCRERFFNFYDNRLMGGAWMRALDAETIAMFFRLLAVCHTVSLVTLLMHSHTPPPCPFLPLIGMHMQEHGNMHNMCAQTAPPIPIWRTFL